ncbi:uncharacterized protein BKA78DRAFT_300448 [Phyllosticta capitalensis]|uniref:uncharacterized protein n=1 Tax=Phyllosticta capitalensis TaxID=121624 RepID=UPI003131CE3A
MALYVSDCPITQCPKSDALNAAHRTFRLWPSRRERSIVTHPTKSRLLLLSIDLTNGQNPGTSQAAGYQYTYPPPCLCQVTATAMSKASCETQREAGHWSNYQEHKQRQAISHDTREGGRKGRAGVTLGWQCKRGDSKGTTPTRGTSKNQLIDP